LPSLLAPSRSAASALGAASATTASSPPLSSARPSAPATAPPWPSAINPVSPSIMHVALFAVMGREKAPPRSETSAVYLASCPTPGALVRPALCTVGRASLYACHSRPVNGYDGLFARVRSRLSADPLSGHLFIFLVFARLSGRMPRGRIGVRRPRQSSRASP